MGNWQHFDTVSLTDYLLASSFLTASGVPVVPSVFVGLQLQRCLVLAALSGSTNVRTGLGEPPLVAVDVRVSPVLSVPVDERGKAFRVLLKTAEILSGGRKDTADLRTVSDGGRSIIVVPPETGAIPVAVAAAVVIVGLAEVAVVGYLVHRATDIVDRELARNDAARALVQKDATALGVIQKHTDREAAAGQTLPLDDASKLVLGDLAAQQALMISKPDPGLSGNSALPAGGFSLFGLSLPEAVALGVLAVVGIKVFGK